MSDESELLSFEPNSPEEEADFLELLELEHQESAFNSLADFVRSVDVPGVPPSDEDEEEDEYYPVRVEPAAHHLLLCDKLEAVERGEIKRLMVLMPPGSAKSTFASVVFPAWFLGRKPNRSIISTSYGSELPRKFGRRCRNLVRTPEYEAITGQLLTGDNTAADNWGLTNGSEYMSAGILAGITGNRTDGLIIDDPIKGRDQADSETVREKTWEAYKSDLRTRVKPNGFIILILTRWHEDDPAGRILPDDYRGESGWITAKDGERWYVLCLQAECEREDDPLGREIGEFIWPEWFSGDYFTQEKTTQGPRNWFALFQQRPAPDTGSFFRTEWFRYYKPSALPPVTIYASSDLAVTDEEDENSEDAAYTVHMIAGVDRAYNLYLIDVWREKTHSGVWTESLIDMAITYKPLSWLASKGQIEKSAGPFIRRRIQERNRDRMKAGLPAFSIVFEFMPEVVSKPMRAQSIRGRAYQGKVFLPEGKPWVVDFLGEMAKFPAGKYADQVDALARFGQYLDAMYGKMVLPEAKTHVIGSPEYIKDQIKQMAKPQRGRLD